MSRIYLSGNVSGFWIACTQRSAAHVSQPTDVAIAVLRAIKQNLPEVMLDGILTRLLFSNIQLFPKFGDTVYRLIGLTKLNQTCAENQMRQ
jgi:hypothetical protein